MSWFLYTDKIERVPKCHWTDKWRGWSEYPVGPDQWLGWPDDRRFRPVYFVVKMARGYRFFKLDAGTHERIDDQTLTAWWQCAAHGERRFPNIASVEMYLRSVQP